MALPALLTLLPERYYFPSTLDSKKTNMKKYIKFQYILCITLLLMQSCKKGYFDLNQNPNLVSNPSLPSLLSTATHKTGINSYNVAYVISPYVQYTANPSAGSASDTYQERDLSTTWDALYYAMADISDMKKLAIERNASEYLGVSNVLLSYHVSLVSDLWGDAPFSEAFDTKTFTPKFDSQQELYNTSIVLLDSAIAQLGRTGTLVPLSTTNDLIHKGSRALWLKTAHALKARALLKVSKTPAYNPAAILTAVSNSFVSNAEDAGMASFAIRNPWAAIARANALNTLDGWLSENFINHLNGTTYGIFDPRIRKITDPTTVTTHGMWVGTVNGAGNRAPGGNTTKDENYIAISSPWTSDVAPLLIVTFAEVKFIEAEAALAANDRPRAYTAYLAGINANMDKLQVPAGAERTAYIAAASVGATNLTRDMILKEKYIATYLNPEAWNDARRYDYRYKDFKMPVNAVLPTFIRRLTYPNNERSENGANVPAAVPMTERLWWDK
jgi:hypothetical protein